MSKGYKLSMLLDLRFVEIIYSLQRQVSELSKESEIIRIVYRQGIR